MTVTPDPYGTDIAIAGTGDLAVTHSGALAAVSGPDNCVQAVYLRLLTPLGDLTYAPEFGSQIAERQVGSKLNISSQLAALNSDLRTMVSDDPRFVAAKVTQARVPANTGQAASIQLGVQAQLFGGEQLNLADVSNISPSDVQVPMPTDPSIDPTLTWDPTTQAEFNAADPAELSQLNDLNALQTMVDDFPPSGGVA